MSRLDSGSRSSRRAAARIAVAPVIVAFTLALVGCGGAGSTLSGPGTAYNANNAAIASGAAQADAKAKAAQMASAGTGRIAVFVTQAGGAQPPYDHIWATIHKVELIGTDEKEKPETLWSDEEGRTVDLVALADGRSALLAVGAVTPARLYGRVRVTLGKSFQLFERGAQSGTMTPVAPGIATGEAGRPVVTFPLFKARALAGSGAATPSGGDKATGVEDIVIAFDLAKFAFGKTVMPSLSEGDKKAVASATDITKQSPARFVGVVSQIAGGGASGATDTTTTTGVAAASGRTFLLTTGEGKAFIAETRPETAVYNANETSSPQLIDNTNVAVWGVWDAQARRVVASDVVVYEGGKKAAGGASAAEIVRGRVEGTVEPNGVFSLAAQTVEGFLPTKSVIAVTPGKNNAFRSRGGLPMTASEARTALALPGARATVEGDYDPVQARVVARRIKVETAAEFASSSAPNAHEALAVGTLASAGPNIADQFALVSLSEWDGWAAPASSSARNNATSETAPDAKPSPSDANKAATNGALVPVAVTERTLFRDERGAPMDRGAFFRLIAANDPRAARVRGTVGTDGKLTAMAVELRAAPVQPIARANGDDATGAGATPQTGR